MYKYKASIASRQPSHEMEQQRYHRSCVLGQRQDTADTGDARRDQDVRLETPVTATACVHAVMCDVLMTHLKAGVHVAEVPGVGESLRLWLLSQARESRGGLTAPLDFARSDRKVVDNGGGPKDRGDARIREARGSAQVHKSTTCLSASVCCIFNGPVLDTRAIRQDVFELPDRPWYSKQTCASNPLRHHSALGARRWALGALPLRPPTPCPPRVLSHACYPLETQIETQSLTFPRWSWSWESG